jgi:hypothetical protein
MGTIVLRCRERLLFRQLPDAFCWKQRGIVKVDFALLTTLHRLLRQRTDLNERIARGPMQITAAENAERLLAAELDAAKESKTQTRKAADQKQLQLNERDEKIKSLQRKLNSAESNREYQLLKENIAADVQASAVLSDEILELLERLDESEQNTKSAEANLARAQQESARVRQSVNTAIATLQNQLESVQRELTEFEAKLTGDVGAEYRRMASKRGEDALAVSDMQTCGNCHTKITTQKMNELLMKQAVFCQSCGALFYIIESPAVTR